ncbi:MAG: aminoglycoside phosphotransferase family protein [Anaerolineae bacterium]|nr:aminoglycoside phosphotransferase family protein [Anaerolineae bacterium]
MALEPLPLGDTLGFFGLPADLRAAPLGRGLIHRTFTLAQGTSPEYVLQEINTRVFADPGLLDANLRAISAAFRVHHPEAAFVHRSRAPAEQRLYRHPASGRYFRIFPFVTNTVSHDTVSDADTAFEAARQFGLFARRLSCLPIDAIRPSLPRFHDLDLRVAQFERSLREGNPDRIATCAALIQRARAQLGIAEGYRAALASGALIPRLMHHDTKISNVLFDARTGKGICVVDLDTVMPGTLLSDIGDMLRTYVCPVDENHRDLKRHRNPSGGLHRDRGRLSRRDGRRADRRRAGIVRLCRQVHDLHASTALPHRSPQRRRLLRRGVSRTKPRPGGEPAHVA